MAYIAVLGQSELDESEWKKEIPDKLPPGLIQYRYLMSPIRLSMMKLLYKNFSLTSIEIKNELSISWGDYANHINSLEKRKFVSIQTEFREAVPRQIVYLEELGRQEYEALIELLEKFLETAKHEFESSDQQLYPND
ncbi:MAG: transcriptional regulator [Candidatus Kariarchaeaceae archaeon]|jgi:DNA-binding MarR family transcriptional regulator